MLEVDDPIVLARLNYYAGKKHPVRRAPGDELTRYAVVPGGIHADGSGPYILAGPVLARIEAAQRALDDYRRLGVDGTVNPERYHTDAVYHAVVYRLYQGHPPVAALRDRGADREDVK